MAVVSDSPLFLINCVFCAVWNLLKFVGAFTWCESIWIDWLHHALIRQFI